jgi:predicted nucleic acid-binding protein
VSTCVLDSSVALTWCFDDEASSATDLLLDRVRDEGATVPLLFHIELGNVLLQAEKRGRIEASDVASRMNLFNRLPITIDQEMTARAWRETVMLARAERLTLYDATYLELAVRLRLDLLTKDVALAEAGRRLGVDIYPS